MGAQGCFCTRCVIPKLNLVVWTCMEHMIFDEMPDFERGRFAALQVGASGGNLCVSNLVKTVRNH